MTIPDSRRTPDLRGVQRVDRGQDADRGSELSAGAKEATMTTAYEIGEHNYDVVIVGAGGSARLSAGPFAATHQRRRDDPAIRWGLPLSSPSMEVLLTEAQLWQHGCRRGGRYSAQPLRRPWNDRRGRRFSDRDARLMLRGHLHSDPCRDHWRAGSICHGRGGHAQ
jgi:hypothetical protein